MARKARKSSRELQLDLNETKDRAVPTPRINVDADGYGNHCDTDFKNNGFVNFVALGLLRVGFFVDGTAPE